MFDFQSYNDELDRLLGKSQLAAPNVQFEQPQTNLDAPTAPQSGLAATEPAQKTKIPVMPAGFDMATAFDGDKVTKANNASELIDAMKPKARNQFMDWWEQQYGAINDHYDQVRAQIGQRPDADRKLSRKEKWAALMDFGLNLIKSSQSQQQGGQGDNLGSALAVAAGNTVSGIDQKRNLEAATYDQKAPGVETGRQTALKNLGSYGDALKGQASIDADRARQAGYERETDKAPDTLGTDQGQLVWDGAQKKYVPMLDAKGQPYTNLKVGARGGVDRDSRSSEEKKYDHLTTLGLPKDAAMRIAYRQTSGSPVKDYKDVYRTAMTSNFGNSKKAKEIADSFISFVYGADAIQEAQQAMVPEESSGQQKVTSQAEYNALPSGTKYLAPDGSVRTKK